MARFALALAAALSCSTSVLAQQAAATADAKPEKWNVDAPPAELAANNKRRGIAPEGDYVDDDSAREARKLADLLILDADPTQDIRNTEKIHRAMLGGRLYDPLTMDDVDTGTRKRQPYWWEADKP